MAKPAINGISTKLTSIAEDSARGAFALMIGDAATNVLAAIASILIARLLDPDGYGLYTLALTVPLIMNYLMGLGLDQALIRFPAKLRSDGRESLIARTIRAGMGLRFLIGVLVFLLVFTFSWFFATYLLNRPDMSFLVSIASITILLQSITSPGVYALMGLNMMGRSVLINLFMSITKVVTAPLLILLGFGVAGAVAGHVLGYLAGAIVGLTLLYWVDRYLRTLKASPPGSLQAEAQDPPPKGGYGFRARFHYGLCDLKPMIIYGFPLYFCQILIMLVNQYQFLLLAFFVSNFDIGNYNATISLSAILTMFNYAIALALVPAFSRIDPSKERSELQKFFDLTVRYGSLILVPVSTMAIIFSDELVYILYGASYTLAPFYFSLYTVLFLFTGIGYSVLESMFNGIGATRLTLRMHALRAGLFIPLAPLATQLIGVTGTIIIYLLASLAYTVYGLYLAGNRYGLGLNMGKIWRIYVASGIATAPVVAVHLFVQLGNVLNLAVGAVSFLAIFLTVAPIVGAVRGVDLENADLMLGKSGLLKTVVKPVMAYELKLIRDGPKMYAPEVEARLAGGGAEE